MILMRSESISLINYETLDRDLMSLFMMWPNAKQELDVRTNRR